MRLWLLGDDEALDILAELSRHLDYFSVARLDANDAIEAPLGPDDHVVTQRPEDARLGSAGLVVALSRSGDDSAGARAIVAASALVEAQRALRRRAQVGA